MCVVPDCVCVLSLLIVFVVLLFIVGFSVLAFNVRGMCCGNVWMFI